MAENRAAAGGIPLGGRYIAIFSSSVRRELDQPALQMKLTPNIDELGRKSRLVGGIIASLCAIGLIIAWALTGSRTMLIVGIILAITGPFMIFEAAHGWCVLRAMGMKTPM